MLAHVMVCYLKRGGQWEKFGKSKNRFILERMNKGLKKLEDDEIIRIYGENHDVLEISAQDWDMADGMVTVSAIDELIEIQLYGEGSNCLIHPLA
jgi:hypothetical protein